MTNVEMIILAIKIGRGEFGMELKIKQDMNIGEKNTGNKVG